MSHKVPHTIYADQFSLISLSLKRGKKNNPTEVCFTPKREVTTYVLLDFLIWGLWLGKEVCGEKSV